MSKHSKTLQAMRDHALDWRIEDLELVAKHHDITVREPAGSHVAFMKDRCPLVVTVPAKRPIKPVYLRQFVELIDWSE